MKNIVISGCDTGFGRMLLDKLTTDPIYRIVALCRDADTVRSYSKMENVVPIRIDLANDIIFDVEGLRLFDIILQEGIYCIINNAGVNDAFSFDLATSEEIARELNINYMGAIRLTKMCIPYMKKLSPEAMLPKIIFVTSWTGVRPGSPMMGPYSATKAALISAAVSLRQELAPFGIKVINVMPGFHNTQMLDASPKRVIQMMSTRDEQIRKDYGEDFPERFEKNLKNKLTKISADPNKVVKKLVKIIETDYPNNTYKIGWDARLFTMMPTALVTYLFNILRKHTKMVASVDV